MARRLTAAVVLAAGAGTRFGTAKQFARIGGATLLDRAIATASAVADDVVAVLPAGADAPRSPDVGVRVVTGGPTRRDSVAAGLAALSSLADEATVLVHDAAHPLATAELARRLADRLAGGAAAVVPVLPANETVKTVSDGRVSSTIPRGAMLAQMPHAFRLGALRAAHALDAAAQDDSGLVEALGVPVEVVDGEVTNVHVTTAAELEVARALAPLVDGG